MYYINYINFKFFPTVFTEFKIVYYYTLIHFFSLGLYVTIISSILMNYIRRQRTLTMVGTI